MPPLKCFLLRNVGYKAQSHVVQIDLLVRGLAHGDPVAVDLPDIGTVQPVLPDFKNMVPAAALQIVLLFDHPNQLRTAEVEGGEGVFDAGFKQRLGIQVGNAKFSMEDGLLCGGTDDAIVYFKKVPESRLNEEQADKATQEVETKSPETTAPATEATTEPTVEATTEPTTAPTTEATTEPTTEATTVPPTEATAELIDGMRPEFKEAMDAYEAFYKEYCELLKKYAANPTDFSILGQYANMLTKADEVDKAFKKWDESDLNSEELKYYLDVNNRVLKMMVDVTG